MLFLWVFGNNVEDAMGRVKFVFFYLLGGLAAMGLQTAVDPSATVPSVGASGRSRRCSAATCSSIRARGC